jgi:hypothetical protein
VGAFASDSLGLLSGIVPNEGFSSVPTCTYPRAAKVAPASKRGRTCAKPKRRGKAGKRGKRGKRRCGKRKRPAGRAAASPASAQPAAPSPDQLVQLAGARLELLGPGGGVVSVGDQTVQAPALGYSCAVVGGTGCSDSGQLLPATPGASYVAEFDVRLAPPPGESWVRVPPGCSIARAPVCSLRSGTVSPKL